VGGGTCHPAPFQPMASDFEFSKRAKINAADPPREFLIGKCMITRRLFAGSDAALLIVFLPTIHKVCVIDKICILWNPAQICDILGKDGENRCDTFVHES